MGKNKLKKFEELLGFEHVFQCTFEELNSAEFEKKGRWATDVFKNSNPIVLELGCGKGEYTVGQARRFPEKNFIGIDIKGARIYTGAVEAKNEKLKNVAFLRTGINLLENFFADGEIAEIWLTFPDPQMKKTRKRLTSAEFLKMYARLLGDGGTVNLKTDSNFLYTYTLAMIQENGLPLEENIADIYASAEISPTLEIKTFYEKQWLSRGITIKYLKFSISKEKEINETEIEIPHDTYRSFGRNQRSKI